MSRTDWATIAATLVMAAGLGGAACQTDEAGRSATAESTGSPAGDERPEPGGVTALPDQPEASASSAFWDHWGDGRAELSTYEGEVSRYGAMREAEMVLIYVTEPHDRRRWIKDDDAPDDRRVNVMKLNRLLKFQTGIYPYSVMTSTFAPTADWGRGRFQPTKITLTAQEWCGHVFHGIWPGPDRFMTEIRSYFASEGEHRELVDTPEQTLYQDALPIQLRELDGSFAGGGDWSGTIVPTLWHTRKGHTEPQPEEATITRRRAEVDETPVHRFVLSYADVEVTYDIERAEPHRLVRWQHSDGSHLRLKATKRLPYWQLNRPGDESHREDLGLEPNVR